MMNGRPLGIRKTIRLMIALTILAWATQTLLAQWGFGGELAGEERFVPRDRFVPQSNQSGATLELRSEATIYGTELTLRQVCRWSDAGAAVFAPLADLKIGRFSDNTPFRSVSLDEVRSVLQDAGVNLAVIRFAGAMTCTVNRGDVRYDEGEALQQWIAAKNPSAEAIASERSGNAETLGAATVSAPPQAPAIAAAAMVVHEEPPANRTLRDHLLEDLSARLSIPTELLQVQFDPQHDTALKLVEPHFRFHIVPRRVNDLGQVSWEVKIITDQGTQRVHITAVARAWQDQLVAARPIAFKQIIRTEDVVTRRTLVDQLTSEPLLTPEQAIGQQAARELKPGTLLTARMVDAVPLVRPNQLVSITLHQGNVKVKTVGRAMEGGVFGQTIRVRNEGTKDIFQVTLTGPQTGVMGSAGEVSSNLAALSE